MSSVFLPPEMPSIPRHFLRRVSWNDVPEPDRLVPDKENFTPYQVVTPEGNEGLFTGYYEPEVRGSFTRSEIYKYPLYKLPNEDLISAFSRAEITHGALGDKNLELIWCADPIEVFFLHIQGSGKIILPNGAFQRVGFAGKNGRPYTAIGKILLEKNLLQRPVTMQKIKDWLREHADASQEILNANESFIYFKLLETKASLGASGAELIPEVSLAIDNSIWPYGLDVIVATQNPLTHAPLNLRMVTHDTGSAIKGTIRGDIFFGSGDKAAELAGAMAQKGKMFVLLRNWESIYRLSVAKEGIFHFWREVKNAAIILHMLKAPRFWIEKISWQAKLLLPISWLYAFGLAFRRSFSRATKVSVPVICIGNHVVGGAGKTPVTREVARRLTALGCTPHIVSRGYGRTRRGVIKVDAQKHTARDVGDEPLLLARTAPVWVSENKIAGAVAAILDGADCVILDDGLQNPSIYKDFTLLVMDGRENNGCLLPAGPLRESFPSALRHVNAVIWLSESTPPAINKNIFTARSETRCASHNLNGKKILAFSGIANPQKFYDGLKKLGAEIISTHDFPDHHIFSTEEISTLRDEALRQNALLATTAKDAARLSPDQLKDIAVCDVELVWDNATALDAALKNAVNKGIPHG